MRLAAQGLRNFDGGNERVEDAEERAALRRQALKVQMQSLIATAVATALFMAI